MSIWLNIHFRRFCWNSLRLNVYIWLSTFDEILCYSLVAAHTGLLQVRLCSSNSKFRLVSFRYEISSDGSVLSVDKALLSDSGVFQCFATNDGGQIMVSTWLSIASEFHIRFDFNYRFVTLWTLLNIASEFRIRSLPCEQFDNDALSLAYTC